MNIDQAHKETSRLSAKAAREGGLNQEDEAALAKARLVIMDQSSVREAEQALWEGMWDSLARESEARQEKIHELLKKLEARIAELEAQSEEPHS